ncbi:MAG: hypothetical protein IID61_17970 [SAR324 cluster bacterium]|nr:hypothetical protein [SAR324 cluster bacterium]
MAIGARDADTLTTMAGRLARLDQALDDVGKGQVEKQADHTLKQLANNLLDAVDPDQQMDHAQAKFGTDTPTEDQVAEAAGHRRAARIAGRVVLGDGGTANPD